MTATAPDALVDTVSPLFGNAGSAWYFTPETIAAGKAIGLDGFRFYFLGRGGVLGAVDWPVVLSAFGYFSPSVVEHMWTTGLERADLGATVTAHLQACADFGRARLAGVGELDDFCAAAEAVVESARKDLGGLTLFAGYAAQPLPADLPGRAIHLTAVLRELRGSVHLSAVAATGLATPLAHAIRRPDFVETFGWKPGDLPEPTDADRALLAEADRLTDAAMARRYEVLDGPGRDALLAGAQAIGAAVAGS